MSSFLWIHLSTCKYAYRIVCLICTTPRRYRFIPFYSFADKQSYEKEVRRCKAVTRALHVFACLFSSAVCTLLLNNNNNSNIENGLSPCVIMCQTHCAPFFNLQACVRLMFPLNGTRWFLTNAQRERKKATFLRQKHAKTSHLLVVVLLLLVVVMLLSIYWINPQVRFTVLSFVLTTGFTSDYRVSLANMCVCVWRNNRNKYLFWKCR